MTIKEIAELTGAAYTTVRRVANTLFPDQTSQGEKSAFDDAQAIKIIGELKFKAKDTARLRQNGEALRQNGEAGQSDQLPINARLHNLIAMHREALDVIETMIPKVEAYDAIVSASGLYSMSEASKLLGHGRNRLFELLRSAGVLMENNTPYQTYMERGYFEVKSTTRNNILLHQTFLTGKGVVWLQRGLPQIESRLQIAGG